MLVSAAGLRADPVSASVFSVSGTVEIAAPGSSSYAPLKKGQVLAIGSTIRTGDDGIAVLLTTPGSAIQLGNDSIVKLNALAFAKSGGEVTERKAELQLTSGVISALIHRPEHAQSHRLQDPDPAGRRRRPRHVLRRAGLSRQDLRGRQRGQGRRHLLRHLICARRGVQAYLTIVSERFLKKFVSDLRRGKVFFVGAMAGLSVATLALGQTAAPAPAPVSASGQIVPGNTGSISPAGGVKPSAADAPHKVLAGALSPKTRQTLQEAMDSARASDSAPPVPPAK
jgi:hypothetical protein